jgi:hypothetical protein
MNEKNTLFFNASPPHPLGTYPGFCTCAEGWCAVNEVAVLYSGDEALKKKVYSVKKKEMESRRGACMLQWSSIEVSEGKESVTRSVRPIVARTAARKPSAGDWASNARA